MSAATKSSIVKNVYKLNDFIYSFELMVEESFPFKAGQYGSIFMDTVQTRPFSIASSPKKCLDKKIIRFIIGPHPDGVAEGFIKNLKIGDSVNYRAPFGIFTLENTIPDYMTKDFSNLSLVFVATSTGIAPIVAMIEHLCDIQFKGKVVLYFGMRKSEDRMMEDEFVEIKQKLNFEYYISLSQEENINPEEKNVFKGYVSDPLLARQNKDDYFYICGSTKNVSAISEKLNDNGIQNIFFENYG